MSVFSQHSRAQIRGAQPKSTLAHFIVQAQSIHFSCTWKMTCNLPEQPCKHGPMMRAFLHLWAFTEGLCKWNMPNGMEQ